MTETTYVALLRGINVGVHQFISMADLKDVFVGLGFGDVETYINSGNVIFVRHTIDSPDILASLDPKPEIEELRYHPGVLFWSAKTSSLTKSGMLKVSRMPIYNDMTVRVLHTTQKIHEIMKTTGE